VRDIALSRAGIG